MRLVVGAVAIATAACLVTGPLPTPGRLVAQGLSRAQIRSMPILERPNRPGHIYGNAVRRRYSQGTVAAPVRQEPPGRPR